MYYLEERRLNRLAHKENAKNILLGAVAPEKLLERFLHLEGSYDVFLFSNISLMNQYLILALKRRNPRLQWLLFEDGATTYSQQVGGLVQSTSPKVRVQLHQVQKLQGMYLFHPETLDWKPGCPVHKLPQAYAPATLELLNRLFRYDKLGTGTTSRWCSLRNPTPATGWTLGTWHCWTGWRSWWERKMCW